MGKYYEAYNDRYRQAHAQQLCWAAECPSPVVEAVMGRWGILPGQPLLEIGCGEGRDASWLLNRGHRLLATDISPEAIRFCREKFPNHAEAFQILNCVGGTLQTRFSFIYAVAVIHMLVEDGDRQAFYRFIWAHLEENGIGLVCSMGDGTESFASDPATAFQLCDRVHGQTGKTLKVAGTSCRVVDRETFLREIRQSGLQILEDGLTAVEPDFPVMLYAVVKK